MSDHPCEQCLLGWLEDPDVVCICVVRPLNAVVASELRQPLTAGIMARHSVTVSYREHPEQAVRRILATFATPPQRSVALCALDANQRIKSQLFWTIARPQPAVASPTCARSWTATDRQAHEIGDLQGDDECKTHTQRPRGLHA